MAASAVPRVLRHYDLARPHQGLNQETPLLLSRLPRPDVVVCVNPMVGGLLHDYLLMVASARATESPNCFRSREVGIGQSRAGPPLLEVTE